MSQFVPAPFSVVYYFDDVKEDFDIAGIFTKPEDASDLCAILTERSFRSVTVNVEPLEQVKRRLLDWAIAEARRVQGLAPEKIT